MAPAEEADKRAALGNALLEAGRLEEALTSFQRAEELAKKLRDPLREADDDAYIGLVRVLRKEAGPAVGAFKDAYDLYARVKRTDLQARTRFFIGLAQETGGEPIDAADSYLKALPEIRTRCDTESLYLTVEHICRLDPPPTEKDPKQLLHIDERMSSESKAARDELLKLSLEDQLKNGDRFLVRARDARDLIGEGRIYLCLGLAATRLNQKGKALALQGRSLELERRAGFWRAEAATRVALADLFWDIARREEALEQYSRALLISYRLGLQAPKASVLTSIGNGFLDLHRTDAAERCFTRSLALSEQLRDLTSEERNLIDLGVVADNRGRQKESFEYFERALAMAEQADDNWGKMISLGDLADVASKSGDNAQALDLLRRAVPLARLQHTTEHEARFIGEMAEILAGSDPNAAIWLAKRSVNLFQSMRAGIANLDAATRQGFRDKVSFEYHSLVDLLARRGRIAEAEQVLRLLKDDELYQYVRGAEQTDGSGPSFRPKEAGWDADYEAQTRDLAEIERQAEALRSDPKHDESQLRALRAKLNEGQRRFDELFQRIVVEAKATEVPEKLERITDQSIAGTLATLPKGTVAIYAVPTTQALRLFYFTPGISLLRKADIKSEDLNSLIIRFRSDLTDPLRDPRPLGRKLYDLLVGPISKDLAGSHAHTLMWSLDGQLRYIPLAALYDGQSYLVEKYDLSVFNPAGREKLEREPPPSDRWRALAAGVSEAHDVKESDGTVRHFPALSGVPLELDGVKKAMPGSYLLLNDRFTIDSLMDGLDQGPNVVHIATHFHFRPGDDSQSYLLTGSGAPLRVSDTQSLTSLSFQRVSLLTLSACETGLGGADSSHADGSEVEGIAAILQRKGAEAVLATLWEVPDVGTARLMAEFYRLKRSHPDWSKAHALQTAQIEMLRGQLMGAGAITRGESNGEWHKILPKYSHPYYWAPFVLMGNWK
jgi:CHAT domain-containing protein